MTSPVAVPDPPPTAVALFGDQVDLAVRYCALLAGPGVERGLIGPRERPVLWSRHLLNCAVLGELIAADDRVVDIGSGAGLPGLVVAVLRPDLRVDLVEPLERRALFLTEAVETLALTDRVRVVRGRAEQREVRERVGGADVVTSRAVAPLDRLVGWSLPLVRPGGRMLALKGARASAEAAAAKSVIARTGGAAPTIVTVGSEPDTATVVVVERLAGARREQGRHNG